MNLEGARSRIGVLDLDGRWLGELSPGPGEPPLDGPLGVAVAPGGRVLVTEWDSGRLRAFAPDAQRADRRAGEGRR